jgi:hypothetical protein
VAIGTRRVVQGHPTDKIIEMMKGLMVQVGEESIAEAPIY